MSRSRILPYPRVADNVVQSNLGASVRFEYSSNGERLDVEEVNTGHWRLVSPGWRPRLDSLTIRARVCIEHPCLLFDGSSSDPCCIVAGQGARIGIVMKWMLPEMKIRGVVVSATELTASSPSNLSVEVEKTFPEAMVRNRVDVSVELFLIKPSKAEDNVYARVVGSELASLGGSVLHTGGSSGMFPVCSRASGLKSPLWELEININDIEDLERDFSGDICMLYLNSDHRLYPEVIRTDMSGAIAPLMFEIFSECCVMFLLRVMKTLNDEGRLDELNRQMVPDDDETSTICAARYLKKLLYPASTANDLFSEELENLSKAARIGLGGRIKQVVANTQGAEVK